MNKKVEKFFQNNATAWQFVKYTIFCGIAGVTETVLFMVLNYILPAKGINAPVQWFIFSYPTETGGQGALIAFVISSVVGQALTFITNFKKTFQSTNNVWVSAVGFLILALVTIIGLHTYLGGVLYTALGKVISNNDVAGVIAKVVCQFSGFLLAFPINKYVIMRKATPESAEGAN